MNPVPRMLEGYRPVDPQVLNEMGWQAGDVVSIQGKKKTAAMVWPGYPEDTGTGVVRLDGNTRRNAGISIDDRVPLKIIQATAAESVLFAPTVPLRITGGEEYLKRYMEGRVITRGDIIEISVMGRKIELMATRLAPSKERNCYRRADEDRDHR